MRPEPRPFELYRHFKGDLYQIMAIAHDAGGGGRKVVYQALYGDYKVYVRDLAEFMGETDHDKYPRAKQQYRFERVKTGCVAGQESSVKTADAAIVETVKEGTKRNAVETEKEKIMAEKAAGKGTREKGTETVIEREKEADEINSTKTADTPEITDGTDETTETDETAALDPAVVEYLDAEGYEERLNILTGVHHRITAEMLATMAVVSDIELEEGSVEEQYQSLKYCLITKQKFEKVRIY